MLFVSKSQSQSKLFDADALLEHLKVLSSDAYEGRATGEKGNDIARAYLIQHFKEAGVKPLNTQFEQPFSFIHNDKTYQGNNVLGLVLGNKYPNKYIVINAHHDHLGVKDGVIYNGADDNASGMSALIAFAEYLKNNPPQHSIILAAFDAEELGFRGSSYFLESFKEQNIMLMINMDMIGRSAKKELYMVGSRYHEGLSDLVSDFENQTNSQLLIGHDGTDRKQDWTLASDQAPFHQAGIPFLYFGNEDHRDYHRPTDDYQFITKDFYQDAVTMIMSMFQMIDAEGL
jgi:Zn-dependent M28 family amino/carboxypeptidase